MKTLIRGGLAALGQGPMRRDILLEGERIIEIGESLAGRHADNIVDADGCIVLPGAIDPHTHMDLPVSGVVTADDFDSGTRAAVLGGTTTILDFATQEKGCSLRQAHAVWQSRLAGKAHCDVGFHMAITDWSPQISNELDEMAGLGITSFKVYMAYPALMMDDDDIYQALVKIRRLGGICGFHCENGRLIATLTERAKNTGHLTPGIHPLAHPPEVEAEAVSRLLRIAQLARAPVNIVHLSSKMALDALTATRAANQIVFVETCPQYLLLSDRLYHQPDAAKYICSPPLRTREDSEALWAALASGDIHIVGTDHCSFHYQLQKKPFEHDFTLVPNGLPGVEHRLALLMTEGVNKGRISLSQLVKSLSETPARLFGMYPKKGVLSPGSDADVVIWDPSVHLTIKAETQAQRVDYTPYEGMGVDGLIRDVWVRGHAVVRNGRVTSPFRGEYVKRAAPFAIKK